MCIRDRPPIETFNKFKDKFYELSKKAGKKQYLVPYLMSCLLYTSRCV